ncbi:MAG: hypothetical protein U9O97_04360 [Elusimicrobiota bacterium]|nr:hypothetical protein [Elusimicrobiota bacterium]
MEQIGIIGAMTVVNIVMNLVILILCVFIFVKVRTLRTFLGK